MPPTEDILAIPLWINGHAYLTMASAFLDVRDARSGQVKRRTPLCGERETLAAVDAAADALPLWSGTSVAARQVLMSELAAALAHYHEHFAGLLVEEGGLDGTQAAAEIDGTLAVLRTGRGDDTPLGVVAAVCDHSAPFLAPLQSVAPALLAGATVVVKPSPKAPSALFALAELTARSGFPGGVFNVLHGDLAAIESLCAAERVTRLHFSGDATLGARIAAIAARHGKRLLA